MQQDRTHRLFLFRDLDMDLQIPEQVLHPVEHEIYQTMSVSRKYDFLKGRYAIKYILNEHLTSPMNKILISAASSGKPYAPSYPTFFCSISHTDGYAAAAISTHAAVGVDVEKIKARHPSLLRNISDKQEIERLSLVYSPEIITTVLWAIKESAAKADERIYPLKEYKITSFDGLVVNRDSSSWDVSVELLPTHVCAVALAITQ